MAPIRQPPPDDRVSLSGHQILRRRAADGDGGDGRPLQTDPDRRLAAGRRLQLPTGQSETPHSALWSDGDATLPLWSDGDTTLPR